ncbi:OmpA family protein [Pseudidiomarina taiwanensis]|nr:OmpA family protein [Pseudidiomarina taiwanensis]
MKHSKVISSAILASLLAAPSIASAQDNESAVEKFYVGPRIGLYGTDSERLGLDGTQVVSFAGGLDSIFGGVEVGFNFTPEWGYRAYYDYLNGDTQQSGSVDGRIFGFDVLYNFNQNIYAGVGLNQTKLGEINNRFVRVSAGYKDFVADNLAFTVEGAVQQNDGNLTEFMVLTTLRYYFGFSESTASTYESAAPAEPAPAPTPVVVADTDGDGVRDDRDQCADTPMGHKVDSSGCTLYAEREITRELLVIFPLNSSWIPADQKADIADTAEFMKEHPQLNVTIEGHTDSSGEEKYNQWLSERRAKAVSDSLVNNFGIAASRVTTIGYGESRPKVANDSAENRAMNRRIEAKLSVTERVPVQD